MIVVAGDGRLHDHRVLFWQHSVCVSYSRDLAGTSAGKCQLIFVPGANEGV